MVLKMMRQSDDRILLIIQGLQRFALRRIVATTPYLRAEIDLPESTLPPHDNEWQAEFQNLRDTATQLLELTPEAPEQTPSIVRNIDDPGQLADFLRRT